MTNLRMELTAQDTLNQLHFFLVEPLAPRRGSGDHGYLDPPYVWVSDRISTVWEAAEHLGEVTEIREDGSVIIKQSSRHVENKELLPETEKPITWRMKVAKIEAKLHLSSLDEASK